jgi:osmoprotectant transport system substrate-binding protein
VVKQVCAILLIAATLVGCSNNQERRIAIASKNFTEQVILGELLAQQVEAKTNLKVERRLNLGGTFICHQGIVSGEIDIYPEYTGTAFTAILKNKPINDSKVVFQKVKQAYAEQFGLSVTTPLGFNNTFAIIIRQQDAQQLGITTISDAAKHTPKWRAGFGYEFTQRADGFEGLAKTYGLKFAEPPRSMDLGLTYRAIADKQVDFIAGDSTAGLISSLNLFVLKDDKNYFPPYDATVIARKATLEKYPELDRVLQSLEGKISEADMRRLNFMVDGEKRDVKEVVGEFRRSRNL